MHLKSHLVLALFAGLLLGGCATRKSSDPDAPVGSRSASIRVEGSSAAYYAAASGGQGTLYYRGRKYPFSFRSIGAGGTGAQNVWATGDVYNLDRLSDFSGNYTGVRSGLTLLRGRQHAKFTNDKGVVIYVAGNTEGLASSTGASTVSIQLK